MDGDYRKARLLEWLTTPPRERQPQTVEALATELGVDRRSLSNWRRQPEFREAWEAAAREVVGSPERTQQVLDTLFRAAIDATNKQQVTAARLYLEATDAIKPKPIEVRVAKPSDLTDDELDALLSQGAAALHRERNPEGVDADDG